MALLAAVCSGQAQNGEEYYVKHLDFPQGATLQEKVDMAARLVTDATTVGLATDGTDCFPAFRYQYIYRS